MGKQKWTNYRGEVVQYEGDPKSKSTGFDSITL